MVIAVLIILLVFWFLGYGPIEAMYFPLFQLGGKIISLWDILIFLVIIWLIDLLPRPLREIAAVVLVIWLLALFGIIALPGLSNLLVIGLIVGVGLYVIAGR